MECLKNISLKGELIKEKKNNSNSKATFGCVIHPYIYGLTLDKC